MTCTYITSTVSNSSHWDDFFKVSVLVYKQETGHTLEIRKAIEEELDSNRNPIANRSNYRAFVTYKEGQPVARCVAIFQPDLANKMGRCIGQIGYIEFLKDSVAVSQIISTATNWLAQFKVQEVWSDVRFSLNYQVGITSKGFDSNHTFLMPDQPEYYADELVALGFQSIKNLNAYRIELSDNYQIPDIILQQAETLKKQGFSIRRMKMSDIYKCLHHYNSRWNNNFAHTPFSEDELQHLEKSMKLFLDTRFCFVSEFDGEIAGYVFTFPDYNTELTKWNGKSSLINLIKFLVRTKILKRITGLKTAIIGVDKKYEGLKISSLLNSELLISAVKFNCEYMERSWILEDNIASIKQATRIGGVLSKQFSIFSMSTSNTKTSTVDRAAQ